MTTENDRRHFTVTVVAARSVTVLGMEDAMFVFRGLRRAYPDRWVEVRRRRGGSILARAEPTVAVPVQGTLL